MGSTASDNDETNAILDATTYCRNILKECTGIKSLMKDVWAENRLIDFNLWATGVGVSAEPSLHQRLEPQPQIRTVVLDLLSTLATSTGDCKDLGSCDNTNDEFYQVDHTVKTSLAQAMKDTEWILEQIIGVGISIRRSEASSKIHRADANFTVQDYENMDNEDYKQSSEIDIENLRALKTSLLATLVGPPCSEHFLNPLTDFRNKFSAMDDENKKMIHHLVFCNLRRRNRFFPTRTHAEEQARIRPLDAENVNSNHPTPTKHSYRGLLPARAGATKQAGIMDRRETACATQTSSEMTSKGSRRLSEDVCPYTCIFPDCARAYVLFDSRDGWKKHLQEDHVASRYWKCFACSTTDSTEIYHSEKDFEDHIQTMHSDVIRRGAISRLLRFCEKSTPVNVAKCPLCVVTQQKDKRDPDSSLEHIADHLLEFSLQSLPPGHAVTEPLVENRPDVPKGEGSNGAVRLQIQSRNGTPGQMASIHQELQSEHGIEPGSSPTSKRKTGGLVRNIIIVKGLGRVGGFEPAEMRFNSGDQNLISSHMVQSLNSDSKFSKLSAQARGFLRFPRRTPQLITIRWIGCNDSTTEDPTIHFPHRCLKTTHLVDRDLTVDAVLSQSETENLGLTQFGPKPPTPPTSNKASTTKGIVEAAGKGQARIGRPTCRLHSG